MAERVDAERHLRDTERAVHGVGRLMLHENVAVDYWVCAEAVALVAAAQAPKDADAV